MTIALGLSDHNSASRTVSMVRSPPVTVKISWARALSPFLDNSNGNVGRDTGNKLTSLEASYRKLWSKLQQHGCGYTTFDAIPRQDGRVSKTTFYCPIFGNAEAVDILLLNNWLKTLTTIIGHVTSLELLLASPTLLPSVKSP